MIFDDVGVGEYDYSSNPDAPPESGLSIRLLKVLTKHEEWSAMMSAFENEPHLAKDALALGLSLNT